MLELGGLDAQVRELKSRNNPDAFLLDSFNRTLMNCLNFNQKDQNGDFVINYEYFRNSFYYILELLGQDQDNLIVIDSEIKKQMLK
jgi:hypothetical protein